MTTKKTVGNHTDISLSTNEGVAISCEGLKLSQSQLIESKEGAYTADVVSCGTHKVEVQCESGEPPQSKIVHNGRANLGCPK